MTTEGCSDWRQHVIICGLGGVGLRMLEQLRGAEVAAVVIDEQPDAALAQLVQELDVPLLVANPRLGATLTDAGLGGARAIVCLQHRDLDVLETALLARELAPEVRIITRLANPAVAKALVAVTGPEGVLDFAQLVAPAFVEIGLGRSAHGFKLATATFATVTVAADRGGTLRQLYGDLAPVAVASGSDPDRRSLVICPGRDEPVETGDLVTLVGTLDELADARLLTAIELRPAGADRPGLLRRIHLVRLALFAAIADFGRSLQIVLGSLGVLTISSILVLMAFYRLPGGGHLGLVSAAYFTAETLATVGFGDFSFARQSTGLEIFGVLLIVLGATLVTALFALLTNFLVSRRIAQALGRYRVPGMHGHVVVIGLGSLGVRVIELLVAGGHDVVVIDRDESNRHLERARRLGVPVVAADATDPDVLRSVNLERSRGVAVLTSDDLTNIEAALVVRETLGQRFDEVPVGVRLFDPFLARTVAKNFGFRNVRSTSDLAAPWFVGAALGIAVSTTFSLEHQAFFVGSLIVSDGGGLAGLAMADLSARTRVVALRRANGELEYPPRRQTTFAAGDEAFLIGPSEELISVLRRDEAIAPVDGAASGPDKVAKGALQIPEPPR